MIFESENDYESGYTEIFYNDDYLGFQVPTDRHFIINENFNNPPGIKEYAFGNKAYIELSLEDNPNFDTSKLKVLYRVLGSKDTYRICDARKAMRLSEMKTIADLFMNSLWS